jgi:hypothetical protein
VEVTVGEAFGTEPNPLAIVGQELERRARAVTENVDGSAERILLKCLATERSQPVYSLAEVDGLHGQKDATLRREL